MSERLTDAELDEALQVARDLSSLRLTAAIAELRDRRARDLTDDDREALRTVRDHWGPPERESLPEIMEERQRVFAVLDKLLGGGA